MWKQSQIQQRPPSEIERVGIELTIPDYQVGVPPRWGSSAYNTQYEFLHSKGFSKEKIIAELQRRVAEYDHLNVSFGQNLPSAGLAFGRGTRNRSRSRTREKPPQVEPVPVVQRGHYFQQSAQTPYGRPPAQKKPFDPTGGLDTGRYPSGASSLQKGTGGTSEGWWQKLGIAEQRPLEYEDVETEFPPGDEPKPSTSRIVQFKSPKEVEP
ncbi:MAG: hypothetical protein GY820_18475, partial [Gammaproteobacteria bacterium]|nr:hypothetical protein [Gammaproteobacteria bacterium]